MESIEISAKSLDEAKAQAAETLGVPQDQLEVAVIEQTKGLFGKSQVRISAKVVVTVPAEPAAEPEAEAKPAKPARERKTPKKTAEAKQEEPVEAMPEAENGESQPAPEVVATDEDGERFVALVKTLLDAGDLKVTAKLAGVSSKYVTVELDGKDVGHLVGKHGEVLNALQYLVNTIGSRKFANGVRATLDGNSYRKRREEALSALAVRIAGEVKERGEEAVLDALPAFERRIIHKALSAFDGISTYSEGEEPNRCVVIAPAE